MRKLAVSLLILPLMQLPSFGQDSPPAADAAASPAAAQQADNDTSKHRGRKQKAPKESKSDNAPPAPVSEAQLDKQLDSVLGKPPTTIPLPPPSFFNNSNDSSAAGGSPSADTPAPTTGTSTPDTSGSAPDPGASGYASSGSGSTPDASAGSMPDASAGNSNGATTGDDNDNSGDQIEIGDQKISPKTLKAGELNNQAVQAMKDKQFAKAIGLLQQALTIDPTYAVGKGNLRVAYFNAAVELFNSGKYAEAIPFVEKSLALSKQLNRDDAEARRLYEEAKKWAAKPSGPKQGAAK